MKNNRFDRPNVFLEPEHTYIRMTKANCRILIVTRSLPFHHIGGMEVVAWDLARKFKQHGGDVTILTTSCPALGSNALRDGIPITCLATPSGRYSRRWWKLSREAYQQSQANPPDVILSVSVGGFSIINALPKHGKRPLFVAQIHGTSWGEFRSKLNQFSIVSWMKAVKNLLTLQWEIKFRKVDAQIAIGEKVEAELRQPPSKQLRGDCKTFLISNGIDAPVFAFNAGARQTIRNSLGIAADERVVISTSRLHPQKGIDLAMAAFARAIARQPNLRFLIVGNGPDRDRLAKLAEDLGIAKKVIFVGAVGRDALPDYLSAADLFLFATIRVEGLPLNVLEALASGLPALISDHVNNEKFGAISVSPRDAAATADAILAFMPKEDVPRPSRLAEEFTLDYSAQQYLALFEKLRLEMRE